MLHAYNLEKKGRKKWPQINKPLGRIVRVIDQEGIQSNSLILNIFQISILCPDGHKICGRVSTNGSEPPPQFGMVNEQILDSFKYLPIYRFFPSSSLSHPLRYEKP